MLLSNWYFPLKAVQEEEEWNDLFSAMIAALALNNRATCSSLLFVFDTREFILCLIRESLYCVWYERVYIVFDTRECKSNGKWGGWGWCIAHWTDFPVHWLALQSPVLTQYSVLSGTSSPVQSLNYSAPVNHQCIDVHCSHCTAVHLVAATT